MRDKVFVAILMVLFGAAVLFVPLDESQKQWAMSITSGFAGCIITLITGHSSVKLETGTKNPEIKATTEVKS